MRQLRTENTEFTEMGDKGSKGMGGNERSSISRAYALFLLEPVKKRRTPPIWNEGMFNFTSSDMHKREPRFVMAHPCTARIINPRVIWITHAPVE